MGCAGQKGHHGTDSSLKSSQGLLGKSRSFDFLVRVTPERAHEVIEALQNNKKKTTGPRRHAFPHAHCYSFMEPLVTHVLIIPALSVAQPEAAPASKHCNAQS